MSDDERMVLFQECAGDPKKFAREIEQRTLERAADLAFDHMFTVYNAVEARSLSNAIRALNEIKGIVGCNECTDEPECAWHQICQRKENAGFREVGVWEPDGSKFKTYRAENLNGKAMYVKEPK